MEKLFSWKQHSRIAKVHAIKSFAKECLITLSLFVGIIIYCGMWERMF